MKRGPNPYAPGKKLMPIRTTAERLGLDPRTVKSLWESGVAKIGVDIFLAYPAACNVVLSQVYVVNAEEDALQPGSLECLTASGKLIL